MRTELPIICYKELSLIVNTTGEGTIPSTNTHLASLSLVSVLTGQIYLNLPLPRSLVFKKREKYHNSDPPSPLKSANKVSRF